MTIIVRDGSVPLYRKRIIKYSLGRDQNFIFSTFATDCRHFQSSSTCRRTQTIIK